mmetsp:Transcript_129936/g.417037  ORF Transcript_129936/g.417037 Transcript_129936/m.417037 type:complete len:223 (+) Transcript_129936:631-1299(+)
MQSSTGTAGRSGVMARLLSMLSPSSGTLWSVSPTQRKLGVWGSSTSKESSSGDEASSQPPWVASRPSTGVALRRGADPPLQASNLHFCASSMSSRSACAIASLEDSSHSEPACCSSKRSTCGGSRRASLLGEAPPPTRSRERFGETAPPKAPPSAPALGPKVRPPPRSVGRSDRGGGSYDAGSPMPQTPWAPHSSTEPPSDGPEQAASWHDWASPIAPEQQG